MDNLAKHIREQLAFKDRCTVFRPEIARVWPKLAEMVAERNAAIEAFAKEHGWAVEIVDPSVVVTFRKRAADLSPAAVMPAQREVNGSEPKEAVAGQAEPYLA